MKRTIVILLALGGLFWVSVASSGTLVGLGYNGANSQNSLLTVDTSSGDIGFLKGFTFDSGFWNPSSFSASTNRAFALSSANTLYTFDLSDGDIISQRSLDFPESFNLQALRVVPVNDPVPIPTISLWGLLILILTLPGIAGIAIRMRAMG